MIQKINHYLSIILILTVVVSGGIFLWSLTQRKPNIPSVVPKEPVEGKVPAQLEDAITPRPAQPQSFKELVQIVFTEEELATPRNQKLMQVIESPQFQEFLKTHPSSVGDYFDFFQEQGVPVDKNELFATFDNQFQKQFPEETPTELEPYMRELLSGIFRAGNIDLDNIDLGTQAGIKSFQQLIIEFFSDEQNSAWVGGYFQGDYNAFGQWAVEIFQNPIPVLSTESPVVETDDMSIPGQLDLSDAVPEGPIVPQNKEGPPSTELLPAEEIKSLIQGDVNSETELNQPLILDLPEQFESLTNKTFKSDFREKFSPEQFNRTIETLNQHGPKEGLRRLKRSDPEIAVWIEHFLRRQQETD